jgi:hypothetical protein
LVLAGCGGGVEDAEEASAPAEDEAAEGASEEPAEEEADPAEDEFDLEAHFDGQRINFVIGFGAGGGYDVIARMMLPFLEAELPGKPSLTVQNAPGGGGLLAVQEVLRAPADGLTFGMMPLGRFFVPDLLGYEIENFDALEVFPTGRPLGDSVFVGCVRNDVATSWEEILEAGERGEVISFAADEPGGIERSVDFLIAAGAPVRMVTGYGGTAEMLASFGRGETDASGRCSTTSQFQELGADVVADPGVTPLWWEEVAPDEEWLEFLGGHELPPELTELPGLEISDDLAIGYQLSRDLSGGRMTYIRAGAPEPVQQAWLDAVEAVALNPQFQDLLATQELKGGYGPPDPFMEAPAVIEGLSDEAVGYLIRFLGLNVE